MLYGMYVSAAGALANSYRQDVVANNLANAETVGFKRDLALFRSRPTQAQERGSRQATNGLLERLGGGVFALPTYTDFTPASLEETGNPFDVALQGRGFLTVQGETGLAYTRDGQLALDERHRLVTQSGRRAVLDDRGAAIVLDPDQPFKVDEAGVVNQAGAVVARLGVVDFADSRALRKQGASLYVAGNGAGPRPAGAVVAQGALETSGAAPLEELTAMIKAQREFQNNVEALRLQDQMLGLAVTRLGSLT